MATKDDMAWKAEMDAGTLAEAKEISADKKRLAAARKEAQRKANFFARAAGGTTGKEVKGAKGIIQLDS
jgi:hypothetical protein